MNKITNFRTPKGNKLRHGILDNFDTPSPLGRDVIYGRPLSSLKTHFIVLPFTFEKRLCFGETSQIIVTLFYISWKEEFEVDKKTGKHFLIDKNMNR